MWMAEHRSNTDEGSGRRMYSYCRDQPPGDMYSHCCMQFNCGLASVRASLANRNDTSATTNELSKQKLILYRLTPQRIAQDVECEKGVMICEEQENEWYNDATQLGGAGIKCGFVLQIVKPFFSFLSRSSNVTRHKVSIMSCSRNTKSFTPRTYVYITISGKRIREWDQKALFH